MVPFAALLVAAPGVVGWSDFTRFGTTQLEDCQGRPGGAGPDGRASSQAETQTALGGDYLAFSGRGPRGASRLRWHRIPADFIEIIALLAQ